MRYCKIDHACGSTAAKHRINHLMSIVQHRPEALPLDQTNVCFRVLPKMLPRASAVMVDRFFSSMEFTESTESTKSMESWIPW